MSRKLASIQKISALDPIPGADRIEVAQVQGWQVVVKKGDFKVGDLCVYFEIDSILPGEDWCDFMKDRKYRVRTIKLRKQISQGLALRIADVLPNYDLSFFHEGEDLTFNLNVKKYDPQGDKERREYAKGKSKRVQPHAWMLRWGLGRKLHQRLYPRASGSWPEWFPKTDETRVQNLRNIPKLVSTRKLYATEKLDGQSVTFFYHRLQKTGLFSRGLYGVCSRNIWYKNPVANNWWNLSKGLDMQERLENYCNANKVSLAIQGEIVGPGIQGNRYFRDEHELYIFNVYDIEAECYVSGSEKSAIISELGLEEVPFKGSFMPNSLWDQHNFIEVADGISALGIETWREGLVFRDTDDDSFSFKAISNKFLLEGGE